MTGTYLLPNMAVILAVWLLGMLLGHVWPRIGAAVRHAWEKTRA